MTRPISLSHACSGADGGVIQACGDGVRVKGLAFRGFFQQIALGSLEHAQFTGTWRESNGMATGFGPVTAGLVTVQVHSFVIEEGVHDADGVGAAADACADSIGMVDAIPILQLLFRFLSDDLLEVAHHGWERMRSCDRAEQIMGVFDVGDPVAQRLVDGVLEDAITQGDFDDLRAKHAHAGNVQRLTAGIDLSHVDAALESQHGTDRGSGHTMLACTGFGDHTGFCPCA